MEPVGFTKLVTAGAATCSGSLCERLVAGMHSLERLDFGRREAFALPDPFGLFTWRDVSAALGLPQSAGGKQGGKSIKSWSNSPKSRSLADATALLASSSPPHASPKLRRRSSPAASAAVLGRRVETTSTGSGGTTPALRLASLGLLDAACRRRTLDLKEAEPEADADGMEHRNSLGSSSAQRVEVACKGTGTLKGTALGPTDSKCVVELSRRAQPRDTACCSAG